jgi:hypothetical protein
LTRISDPFHDTSSQFNIGLETIAHHRIGFSNDDDPCNIVMSTVSNIEKYEPGQFYKRGLP